MSAGVKNRTTTAVAAAANAILAWGQARRVHEDEAGLTVMTMVLSLAVVLGTLGILLLAYSGGVTPDAASAFDSAVAGS